METEILENAIKNLEKEVNLKPKWIKRGPLDAKLQLSINSERLTFNAEIKKEVRDHQLSKMLALKEKYQPLIIIADRIQEKVKKDLRSNGIAYLESNGNIHLEVPGYYLHHETQNPYLNYKEAGNRAFTKTGLKVLFELLTDKELINKTQREIAEKSGVGLGNIPQIIKGLKETGYLLQVNPNQLLLDKKEELLDRWISDYETTLRPAIGKGNYSLKGPWTELKLNPQKTVWGGEPAADLLTDLLRPEKFVMFTTETRAELIKNYRITPQNDGEIMVFEMFWRHDGKTNTAPPLLIYAELMLEGGKRNKETALKIYHEHIKPNL
ncbi:MAG: hypothetical protein H6581_03645 [Bacteroidia bacterium]|nr:hypothetical protein [Bacteroidia bacterium]